MRIVTALFDIRGASTPEGVRRILDYLELGANTIMSLNIPMTLFTGTEELAEKIRGVSKNPQLEIIVEPFEQSEFYGDLTVIEQRLRSFQIYNWNPKKDTEKYLILNHSKLYYLKRAMAQHAEEDYFLWLDFGVQHAAKASPAQWARIVTDWPAFMALPEHKNKIHQLRIHTVLKNPAEPWRDFFRFTYHHIGGGCFGGHRDSLSWYYKAFWDLWRTILYKEEWIQLDEALYTILVEEHRHRFRLYYGDYDGMITNFIESHRSWFLVFQTLERHFHSRRYEEVHKVLLTLDSLIPEMIQQNPQHFNTYLTCCIVTRHPLVPLIQSNQIPWETWSGYGDVLSQHASLDELVSLAFHDPWNQLQLEKYTQKIILHKKNLRIVPSGTFASRLLSAMLSMTPTPSSVSNDEFIILFEILDSNGLLFHEDENENGDGVDKDDVNLNEYSTPCMEIILQPMSKPKDTDNTDNHHNNEIFYRIPWCSSNVFRKDYALCKGLLMEWVQKYVLQPVVVLKTNDPIHIPIYVLSLNNQRKCEMLDRFQTIGISQEHVTVYPGVSYESLLERVDPTKTIKIPDPLHKTWSIAFGHLDMIRKFYEETNKEWAIFCEDDILLHSEFSKYLEPILQDCQQLRLDILLIGYLCENPIDTYNNFPAYTPHPHHQFLMPPNKYKYLHYPEDTWGAQMYLLSRPYAKQLLETYHAAYALQTLQQPTSSSFLKPFSADWTITKDASSRALLYPLLVVEDGKNKSFDQAQDDSHTRCFMASSSSSFV